MTLVFGSPDGKEATRVNQDLYVESPGYSRDIEAGILPRRLRLVDVSAVGIAELALQSWFSAIDGQDWHPGQ